MKDWTVLFVVVIGLGILVAGVLILFYKLIDYIDRKMYENICKKACKKHGIDYELIASDLIADIEKIAAKIDYEYDNECDGK